MLGVSEAMPGGAPAGSAVDRVAVRSDCEQSGSAACDVCVRCRASPPVWARREREERARRACWCTWSRAS